MSNDDGILVVKQLRKQFDTKDHASEAVFDEVSFVQGRGSFISIVGASGCGKSTLLKIIIGLISPSSGGVYVGGRRVDAPQRGMALVFQDYNNSLLPWRNVKRNVKLGVENQGISNCKKDQRVRKYLEMVGLENAADLYPWKLSGGMQQRVALARALASESEILLLDEPFGSLDVVTKSDLEDEVLLLWSRIGMTVLLVTHDIEQAIYLSDRVLILAGSPARIESDITINLPRPRNQLQTRTEKRFTEIRNSVYTTLLAGKR